MPKWGKPFKMSDMDEHFNTVPALAGNSFKSAGMIRVPHTLAVPIMLTSDKNAAVIGAVADVTMGDQ
jgi:hypothetical protein